MGRNFALNGTKGEVGVSLKKNIFFRETLFHSFTTQTQAVATIYYQCMVYFFFHLMAIVYVMAIVLLGGIKTIIIKLTENAVTLHYNSSLSDCHFSLIFLEGEVTFP